MYIEFLTSDKAGDFLEFFENLFLNLHGEDFEFRNVDDFSPESLKVISYDKIETLQNVKVTNFFLFFEGSKVTETQKSKIVLLGKTNMECKGIFDVENDFGLYVSFVESYIEQYNLLTSQKIILTKLNGSIQSILGQLQRVKSLHGDFVPVRNESVRGIKINSRFSAGTSSGGEFFDFFKSGQNLWLFSMNADSYISIGTFLSLIEQWKSQPSLDINYVTKTLDSTKSEFDGFGDISLLILWIDLASYKISTINLGGHQILSENQILIDSNEETFPAGLVEYKEVDVSLKRGEQIVILSPGFIGNVKGVIDSKSISNFLKTNWSEGPNLIQELTFQSKNKYKELDFLPYDQTVFTVGVDKNVISKV